MNFKKLHNQDQALVICNVWDVASALTAEKLNFKAIGTSSGAIASMLGYQDGEKISFSELEYIVKRIVASTSIALSVDLEAGYSRDVKTIVDHIKRLVNIGVVGVNIEDSIVGESRTMLVAENFAHTIKMIKEGLLKEQIDVFLNIRTDSFLLKHFNPVVESINRIKLYEKAGADGIFLPCIEQESDISAIVACTELPINVMCMPNLPDFDRLSTLGVQRISMGNFAFNNIQQHFEQKLTAISTSNTFEPFFKA